MEELKGLKWRYATKKFNREKILKEEDVDILKKAIQLSASSYGLQPYSVLDIRNTDIREELKPYSWGQSQITDASHLFVFCNYKAVNEMHIERFLALKAEVQGLDLKSIEGYSEFMKSKIREKTSEEIEIWTAKQAYIALGNLLTVAGELKIDTCPIEGFEVDKYDEILGLSEKDLSAAFVVALGYRSSEDTTAVVTKVRKPVDELFFLV